jgi:hypothetical protein
MYSNFTWSSAGLENGTIQTTKKANQVTPVGLSRIAN